MQMHPVTVHVDAYASGEDCMHMSREWWERLKGENDTERQTELTHLMRKNEVWRWTWAYVSISRERGRVEHRTTQRMQRGR